MPAELDTAIEAAAAAAGTTYSGWLADVARKELLIARGLEGVAAFEAAEGVFTPDEIADAAKWVEQTLGRSPRSGALARRLELDQP